MVDVENNWEHAGCDETVQLFRKLTLYVLLNRGVYCYTYCYTGEFIAKLGGSLTARTLIGWYNNAPKAFSLGYAGQQFTPL